MGQYHTVAQGEQCSGIASQYGFMDYRTIWEDDANADLRTQRQNPHTLLPGDQLYIPDKQPVKYSFATGQVHQVQARRSKAKIRLALKNMDGSPLANTECTLTIDGQKDDISTDGDGIVEKEIPATAQEGSLVVKDPAGQYDVELPLKIGHLDPVEEATGQIARLNSLGYNAGPVDAVDARRYASAIEEFQCDNGLTVDGKVGPMTRAKLKEIYGC
jgi:hypothetical protein